MGVFIDSSSSSVNNVEIIEYTFPTSGTYSVRLNAYKLDSLAVLAKQYGRLYETQTIRNT